MYDLSSLKNISFPSNNSAEASLTIFEGLKEVPFEIARVFVVHTKEVVNRGHHAHKECTQLLVVLNGQCTVICDDGHDRKEIVLTKTSEGLLIPPTIWAEQIYTKETILMVLTDRPYDEEDYIRNYKTFLNFREKS